MVGRSDEVETSDDVRPNDSCTEFYDLTKDFKTSTKRPKNDETSDRRNQRAPSQSRHETQTDKTFRKQLDSLLSVTWMKIKEKKRHARRSTSSDRSEETEREYRRHRKEKRKSRRSSPGKRYRSRSRSPYSRDTEREYYRKRVERRDSVERYRRSRSYERRVERRRSRSHERDSKHSRSSKKYKYSNEQVVKTEAVERFREENDENDSWYMEPERAPESRVSESLFDKLRQKIKSTLQNSSNRNANEPNALVDSTRQLDAQEWQDTFDLDSGSSSESTHKQIDDAETETQQDSVGDDLRAMEKDSNNLVLDMNRKKIKFTFTKSTKTDTSQISSVFNPTATDNLTNARTKLGTLLRSALNDRSGKDDPKETSIETTPVQEHSSIDDDSIDHEIIQKIISQTQVHTSSSYELSVNVPVGFNSAAAVEMFENEMSSESQYTGSTRINSGAHTDAQAFTGPSVVNTTTTQVVRSNYSVTTRLNLPTPSTKFLPAVRKRALSLHHVNSFDHQPFNNAIGSRDQISEKATTYGEHKNRLALGNFKIPKISRSTSSVSNKSDAKSNFHGATKINENDSANYDRPTTSSQWKDSPQWNEELNIRCYRNPTENDTAPKPVTNVSKMETARKSLMNYKIPKKTTKENGSMSSALTPVVEMKNVNQNDHKNRNKRPTKSQPTPAIESQIHENQESISRPISISSTSSDESNSGASEITIDNDNKDWNNFERPQSNVDTNVQPDKNPTGNETASPIADASNEQNAMESLKDWMKTNEFATLVDLMQQLAQHKNLEKLKDALSNNNNAARNEEFGEGSSNAESVNATTNVSNGNAGNQKQNVSKFKNIDTAWHSLRKILECQECDKPFGNSLVSHYVNLHPDCEVLTSRLAPEAAENLRSGIYESDIVVAKPPNSSTYHYKQFCYFCNVFRCYNKLFWINHMARHTGYYRLKCKDCSRKFACKTSHGKCFRLNNLEPIPQPQYKKRELLAYVCDLCNFVRFHQNEIEMHLCTEHGDGQKSKQFKKVTFLRFPNAENKYVRKNPVKKYKKRKPKPVEEFLSKLKESEAEIDLKEEIDSEYETDSDSDDDSVSDFGSDWSNMDVQDDDSLTFTETSSDSDFV